MALVRWIKRTNVNHIAPQGLLNLGTVELDNGIVFSEPFRASAEGDRMMWPKTRWLGFLHYFMTSSWNLLRAGIASLALSNDH